MPVVWRAPAKKERQSRLPNSWITLNQIKCFGRKTSTQNMIKTACPRVTTCRGWFFSGTHFNVISAIDSSKRRDLVKTLVETLILYAVCSQPTTNRFFHNLSSHAYAQSDERIPVCMENAHGPKPAQRSSSLEVWTTRRLEHSQILQMQDVEREFDV